MISAVISQLRTRPLAAATLACLAGVMMIVGIRGHSQEGLPKEKPVAVDTPPAPVPKVDGLVVLFSGKPEEVAANWRKNMGTADASWKVADGAMQSGGGDIVSKQDFTDFQLHVEFKIPFEPGSKDQGRGNSGVGLQSHYEIQVLNSYGYERPGKGDCGAVYSQYAPLVNACRPPENWQTYDITFRAPRFGADGKMSEKPRVTVIQNGITVQNNQEINGPTGIGGDRPIDKPGPIYLQDHGHKVQFRNVWVLPLPAQGSDQYGSRHAA